jgi:crotonobetainyl-CoA:carnitine CoA-transferase CaiB-like acyl-CoA transferase
VAGPGALAGLRVVDLANFLAGPLVSMHLADFGADVVKVERPDGEATSCASGGGRRTASASASRS